MLKVLVPSEPLRENLFWIPFHLLKVIFATWFIVCSDIPLPYPPQLVFFPDVAHTLNARGMFQDSQ